MKKSWSIAVLFEDDATRKRAQEFVDKLAETCWAEREFLLDWHHFEALADRDALRSMARRFAETDLIIFANQPHQPLPFHMRRWAEEWLEARGMREGVLVAVCEPAEPSAVSTDTFTFLRRLAHCAGMDYMTDLPSHFGQPMPDAPEPYRHRAFQVTSTLDTILRDSRR